MNHQNLQPEWNGEFHQTKDQNNFKNKKINLLKTVI